MDPKSHMLTVRRGQHRMHAEMVPGSGVPIVLMHGFPDNTHLYDRLLPHLAGRRPVVRFDIDVTSAGILSEHLKTAEALATSPAPVVVDLDRVTFLGSFGIATLIDHHQRCREQSTPLRLVAAHHAVLRPIETCATAWPTR